MKRVLFASIFAITTVGCSSVRDEKVTSRTLDKVNGDVASSKLSEAEKKSYITAEMRAALGGPSLDGKSVREIITDQDSFQAKEDAQAAISHEAQVAEEARVSALDSKMRDSLSFIPVSKTFVPADYDSGKIGDSVSIKFNIQNKSAKIINGFRGQEEFYNGFGDKVITLNIEDGAAGGADALRLKPEYAIYNAAYTWDYNQFERAWQIIKDSSLSSLKAKWVPSEILFSDGSSIKTP